MSGGEGRGRGGFIEGTGDEMKRVCWCSANGGG